MINWWMKLGGTLQLGHDALPFSISGTGTFISPVIQTQLDIPRPLCPVMDSIIFSCTICHRNIWIFLLSVSWIVVRNANHFVSYKTQQKGTELTLKDEKGSILNRPCYHWSEETDMVSGLSPSHCPAPSYSKVRTLTWSLGDALHTARDLVTVKWGHWHGLWFKPFTLPGTYLQ